MSANAETPADKTTTIVSSDKFDSKEEEHRSVKNFKLQSDAEGLEAPHPPSRIVLIAVGESEETQKVLDWSLQNIVRKDSDLVVLAHVRKSRAVVGMAGFGAVVTSDEGIEDSFRRDSHSLLKSYGNRIKDDGYNVKAVSIVGEPGPELCGKVEEIGADLLVLGTRDLSGLKRVFLGSVSEYCCRHAACPVTIVRSSHLQ
ncbi:Universal stress protein A-like protein [Zancudomyces culisetae]|uniref:Universal stress protein A-like protein n=1 Tax=Zancudomyces culisetae TaxID=1213189 RepID=A0A1R1PRZ0_ZANCU|nr:Universal stress protein A-like protein [Zancudomyces culisetae]|eukprot:OMH83750.1 Universal stress protein A-like protein [Zancudomyces culisetae]